MSNIKNKITITDDEKANVLRGAIWTRASWMGLFYDESCKAGFAKEMEEILRKAIYRFGLQQGRQMRQSLLTEDGMLDMTKFPDKLLPPTSFVTFEAEKVNVEDGRAEVTYHFCPLVKGWQDQGFDDERCALLCDIAMEGDRGTAEGMGADLELLETIGGGCATCHMFYTAREK